MKHVVMRQAIKTKYLSVTNTKCSRIKAQCAAGSYTMNYKAELSTEQNHQLAAKTLLKQLGWDWAEKLVGGFLSNGEGAFVLVDKK